MSMEMMKKVVLGAAMLAGAASVQAQTPANVAGQWDSLQVNGTAVANNVTVSRTFSGTSTLTAGSIGATCGLALTGNVTLNDNGTPSNQADDYLTISVTDGDVTAGDFTCNFITLTGFPWDAYKTTSLSTTQLDGSISPSSILDPVDGVFSNIGVSIFGSPTCSGYIEASFQNGTSSYTDPSFFAFSGPIVGTGSCTVTGNLENDDTNAY